MISHQRAEQVAREWVEAWNSHDIEAIMSHYADDVELTSPLVVRLLGDPSGTVRGKENLRSYFEEGLAANPDLGFELCRVLAGVESLALCYRSIGGRRASETMVLDSRGKIVRVLVHYDTGEREE